MVRLQLDVPDSFLDLLDAEVKARALSIKKMSKLEWMNADPHGKTFMTRVLDPYGTSIGKTSEEITKEVQEEYARCVGPAVIGRPKLAPQRLAIITEAVTKYLAEHRTVIPLRRERKTTKWGG